ncbi:MAG: radical SAM protein [Candidatus Sulfotelmatobacter sp.]
MRVTLVIPPEIGSIDEERVEYLGLGYVAAYARHAGYQVDILDCKSTGLTHGQAVARILSLTPKLVGITAPFSFDLTSAVKLAQQLREYGFQGPVVVGGHPATFSYRKLLEQYPVIDVVVRGEGEVTFLEFLRHYESKETWKDVAGIAYRQDGQLVVTAPRPLVADLDSLPYPARDSADSHGSPVAVSMFQAQGVEPGTVILSSRGCPFLCTYCSVQAFYRASSGRPWRCRSVRNVVEEIAELVERWGVRSLRFSDDNFIGSCTEGRRRAEQLAIQLIERRWGVNFVIECRTADVDVPLFSLLKRAGLIGVNLGIETGVPRMLKRFNKHATVEDNRNAISILRDLGIDCHPNFILVDPETTVEELRENFTFLKETHLYLAQNAMQILYNNRLGLFAGTPARDHYVSRGGTSPWKAGQLAADEQVIHRTLATVLDFEDQDERVGDVFWVLERVMPELARRDGVLRQLERKLDRQNGAAAGVEPNGRAARNGNGLRPKIEHWRANAGKVAFQLFEKVLVSAERGLLNREVAADCRDRLLADVERYDRLHFGMNVDALATTMMPGTAAVFQAQ